MAMLSDWLVRLLLLPFPRALRRAHGVEMRQLVRARWREATSSGRAFARMRVAAALAIDVLRSAPAEHLRDMRRARADRDGLTKRKGDPMAWMREFLRDLRYAGRLARLSPLFSLAAIVTLALGIGAAVVIFSLADRTLIRPLPVRDVDRLYAIRRSASHPAYRDYQQLTHTFDAVIAFANREPISLQHSGETEWAAGTFVSGNYFDVLGIGPQAGRMLLPSDDPGPGAPTVAVLSDRFWRMRLAADPAVVGSTLRVNERNVVIVGVAARGFRGVALQADPAVFMPLSNFREVDTAPFFQRGNLYDARGITWLQIAVRLKSDTTPAQARDVILSTYRATHPDAIREGEDPNEAGEIQPLRAVAVGFRTERNLRRFMLLLATVVAIVLLIACANLANMLLVRAAARRREIAVRLALGAGRSRVIRQMLSESVLLAILSGAAGLFVARLLVMALARFRLPGDILIRDLGLSLDGAAIGVAIIVSSLTALLFGLAPAIQTSAIGIITSLKDQSRATARHRLRSSLIAAQVALSLTLLAAGALFARGLERALDTDIGFRSEGAAIATVNLGLQRYDAARATEFYLSSLERIGGVPAVHAAAWARMIPMRGTMMSSIEVEGYQSADGGRVDADLNYVLGNYFEALGLPLLEGRGFTEMDRTGGPLVAIVSRSMTARYWAGRTAVGGRFRFSAKGPWLEVVGVAGDARTRGIDHEPMPFIYLPFLQHTRLTLLDSATLIARTDGDPRGLAPMLRRELAALDRTLPVGRAMTLDDHLRNQVLPQRMGLTLFVFFGALAVVIAGVGIYGVAAQSVAERRRELGIRLALGAAGGQVIRLVQRQTLVPVAAGLAIGFVASVWTARLVGGLLYGLDPQDPPAFVAVAIALGAVALLAAWIPARRAARVDPAIALRHE
jgi:predicted permease